MNQKASTENANRSIGSQVDMSEMLGILLAIFVCWAISPFKYSPGYFLAWEEAVVDKKIKEAYFDDLKASGITSISAPCSEGWCSTVSVKYVVEGEAYTAEFDIESLWRATGAWIDVEADSVTYVGLSVGEAQRNNGGYDYHFENAEKIIKESIAVVKEAEENRIKWAK